MIFLTRNILKIGSIHTQTQHSFSSTEMVKNERQESVLLHFIFVPRILTQEWEFLVFLQHKQFREIYGKKLQSFKRIPSVTHIYSARRAVRWTLTNIDLNYQHCRQKTQSTKTAKVLYAFHVKDVYNWPIGIKIKFSTLYLKMIAPSPNYKI